MRKNNEMHCILYRLRKRRMVLNIDTKNKTIYYNSENPKTIRSKAIRRLCADFGFACQPTMFVDEQ